MSRHHIYAIIDISIRVAIIIFLVMLFIIMIIVSIIDSIPFEARIGQGLCSTK